MDVKMKISETAAKLESNYKTQGIFEIGIGEKMPKHTEVIDIINEVRRVIFLGYFGNENTAYVSLCNFAGNSLAGIYERLFKQIWIAIKYQSKRSTKTADDAISVLKQESVDDTAEEKALAFIDSLPNIQQMIFKDVEAELRGDPAAYSKVGEYFFIDHGTDIVIGETTIIGNHVKLYQGVTLKFGNGKEGAFRYSIHSCHLFG